MANGGFGVIISVEQERWKASGKEPTMKGKWMKIVRQYTIITLGISMMAVGVYFFKFPNNFVFGGVTGAAALVAKLTPISASEFSAVVNMLMLLLGLIFWAKSLR